MQLECRSPTLASRVRSHRAVESAGETGVATPGGLWASNVAPIGRDLIKEPAVMTAKDWCDSVRD